MYIKCPFYRQVATLIDHGMNSVRKYNFCTALGHSPGPKRGFITAKI